MPLPGGPADKLGNRYERSWAVLQLVHILHGEADSIRIEDPATTKAEFVVRRAGRRELHQAKRSHPAGKWTLVSMGAADTQLLQAIYAELDGNEDNFVFASGSDARELAELADRARQSATLDEFLQYFLASETQKKSFERLKGYWNRADANACYEMLRRVKVRTLDERGIDDGVQFGLRVLFLDDPRAIEAELRRIVEESVHVTLARDELIASLARHGFVLRRLVRLHDAPTLVRDVTDRYLTGERRRFIKGVLIPRSATQTLLEQLGPAPREVALTGGAGSGKTACIVELVEALRARGTTVLAFRLDRLEPASTTKALGEQLGLEESPVLVLAAAARTGEAVLIVDQVDAVSTTSGRNSSFLDVVERLLAEVRGVRVRLALHVVIVCRAFDWENDHRLRRILSDQQTRIDIPQFSAEEVKGVLAGAGFPLELLLPRQLELLRLPQNLALFLESGFDPGKMPHFNTAKELFDRYWVEKRGAVAGRAKPTPDHWTEVIHLLCEEMTSTQQLSVRREKLDRFPNDYLSQMVSEGVLTSDGQRFGFGHESFFDYCFARAFVGREEPLAHFLVGTEQHLFRRAQVRQVLTYLRDADHGRYCRELRELLHDERIRPHVKDMALAVIVGVQNPSDQEWEVLEPWLRSEVTAITGRNRNPDRIASLAWQHFFTSASWFDAVDGRGLVAGWLASGNDALIDAALNYARAHQRHAGDRIAELLEPYVEEGGNWPTRLRWFMEWADHGKSRRFFDLFLRLIDNGILDTARGPIAVNTTFWSILHGLAEGRPDWFPEVVAHWLRRRVLVLREKAHEGRKPEWRRLLEDDRFAPDQFQKAAAKAPRPFVERVLPVVLEVLDAAIDPAKERVPKRDPVWPVLVKSPHPSLKDAFITELVAALTSVAKTEPDAVKGAIAELRKRQSYIANFLLLNVYGAGASQFADEAADLLCNQPWRFDCGFSDSPYWTSRQLIEQVFGRCSPKNRANLESTILHYSSEWERTPQGYKLAGSARFALLAAVPRIYRSPSAQARYDELERKFGEPEGPPVGIRGGFVGSPIEKPAAEKMTDEQWLRAIAKYSTDDWHQRRFDDPFKGGATELARILTEFVKAEPQRFGKLALRFPSGTNPAYIGAVLEALKGADALTDLKLAVCRRAYRESRRDLGRAIADLVGSIQDPLPPDVVQMLDWLATEHPDPERELWREEATPGQLWHGGDMLSHGINTVRGRAVEAIHQLVLVDPSNIATFRGTLEHLVMDKSLAVRACAASVLRAISYHDGPLALQLFTTLVDTPDDRLLATGDVARFLHARLAKEFIRVRHVVERMLTAASPQVAEAGARLASIAALHQDSASDLVREAMAGNASQRLGVAQVAAQNIAHVEYRTWCERHLLQLFSDPDPIVRRKAASCFRRLIHEPLEAYETLITQFCESGAYQEDSSSLLHLLEESVHRLPGMICAVCEKFFERFSDEARDIRTHRAADVYTVIKLIFRTYHQHQGDSWAARSLDLIDRTCLEGIGDAKRGLDDFER